MFLKLPKSRKLQPVKDFAEASTIYSNQRDRSGLGASAYADGFVLADDQKTTLARISYNGRVWPPEPWTPDQKPLWDNREDVSK